MKNEDKLIINRLPAKTWYWLGVNDARIDWNLEKTVHLPDESYQPQKSDKEPIRISVKGNGEFCTKDVTVKTVKNSEITVIMDYSADNNLAVRTTIDLNENSRLKLIQLQTTEEESILYNEVRINCQAGATVELIQIFLGKGDLYSDSRIDLEGEGSSLKADIGYIGRSNQNIDINIFANHTGKKTESEINVNGSLNDAAKKVFKGTIDFKNGCTDSVGNEQETVLLLGEDVVNKTVPLILCAEENVVGNHGATIGELDEDTLFYFESRGIDKKKAESIMARAAIDRVARLAGDEKTVKKIESSLKYMD